MFGIFSGVKMALIGGVIAVAVGGFIYVKGLQADLSTAKANNLILTESVEGQKAVIEQMKADFESISEINKKLDAQMVKVKQEVMKKANEGTKEVKTDGLKQSVRQIT